MKQIAVLLLCSLVLAACIILPPPSMGTEPDVPATGAQEALTGFDGQVRSVDPATGRAA